MTSYFCIPVPYNEKDIFFGVLVLNSLVGLIEPFNFSFFSVTDWGIGLDYHDIEWFALEMNRVHPFVFLRLLPSTAFRTLLLTMMATPFLPRDSCLQ